MKNTEYSMFLIRSGYKALSQFLTKKAEQQFIDKDIQECSLILSSANAFSSLLPTSSHYSHVKVLKSSWLFQGYLRIRSVN